MAGIPKGLAKVIGSASSALKNPNITANERAKASYIVERAKAYNFGREKPSRVSSRNSLKFLGQDSKRKSRNSLLRTNDELTNKRKTSLHQAINERTRIGASKTIDSIKKDRIPSMKFKNEPMLKYYKARLLKRKEV